MAVHDSDYYSSHPAACERNASSSNLLQRIKSAETAFLNKQYQDALEKYKGIDNSHSRYMVGLCIANLECHYFMPDEAEEWFRKSAEENNPWAQYILDDEEDLEYEERLEEANQAMHSYLYSYNGGDWEKFAMYEAAMCFRYGKGVKPRARTAFDLFKKASSFKCPKAQYELGLCYKDKVLEYLFEPEIQALYHFSVASRDVPEAYYELAYAYYYGDYVVKDYEKAVRYLGFAISVKHPPAFFLLGNCYLYGHGVAKDEKRATELFENAAEKGHIDAIKALANCYEAGKGVELNDKKALEYYTRAADLGDTEAKEKTEAIKEKMQVKNVDAAPSALLYKTGGDSLLKAVRLASICVNLIVENKALFRTKAEKLEATYFLWIVIAKHLKEQYKYTKLEPCLMGLSHNLATLNYEGYDNAVLASIWVDDRLPTYNHVEITKWPQTLDHFSVWVEHNGPLGATENNMPKLDFVHLGGMTERTERQSILLSWFRVLIIKQHIDEIATAVMKFDECVGLTQQKQQPSVQIAAQLVKQTATPTRIATIKKENSGWNKFGNFLRNLISSHSK